MEENAKVSNKNRFTAMILCWFLGFFGVHRLYAGKLGSGFLMLYGTVASILTLAINVPMGLLGLILVGSAVVYDFITLSLKVFKDCYGKEMVRDDIYE